MKSWCEAPGSLWEASWIHPASQRLLDALGLLSPCCVAMRWLSQAQDRKPLE